MATTIGELLIKLGVESASLTRGLKAAEGDLSSFGRAASDLGSSMSAKITAPLVGIGTAAVVMSNQFETEMSRIQGLVGESAAAVDGMKGSVLELAGSTGKAPQELASALFAVESAGLRGADAMDALEIAAKASTAGLGDTRAVALAAAASMTAYQASGMTAAKATDILTATVREGNLSAEELAGSISRVLPIAAAAGVGLEEIGAAAAIITRSGASAAEAMTQIKASIMALNAPSAQARTVMEEYGLSVEKVQSTLRDDGLVAALQLLNDATGGNAVAMREILGSSEALTGALTLLGTEAGTLDGVFESVANSAGDTQKAFDAATSTSAFQMQQAFNDIKVALVEVGAVLAPVAASIASAIASAVSAFASLPDPVLKVVVAVGAVVAAIGPALMVIGSMASGIGALQSAAVALGVSLGPLALGLAGVTAALAVGVKLWYDSGEAKRAAAERADTLTAALRGQADATEAALKVAVQETDVWAQAADAMNKFGITADDVYAVTRTGTDIFQGFTDTLKLAGGGMYDVGESVQVMRDQLASATDGPAKDMAERLLNMYENGKITREEFEQLANVFDETADAMDDTRESLIDQGKELANTKEAAGNALTDLERMALFMLERFSPSIEDAEYWLGVLNGSLGQVEAESADRAMLGFAESVGAGADAASHATETIDPLVAAVAGLEEAFAAVGATAAEFVTHSEIMSRATEIATEKMQTWAQAQADATTDASDSWKDFATDVEVSIGDYLQALDEQVAAMQSWEANMVDIASRVPAAMREDVLTVLADMGPEAAGLIAQLGDLSDAELQAALEKLVATTKVGGEEWQAELSSQAASAFVEANQIGVNIAAGAEQGIQMEAWKVALAAANMVTTAMFAARQAGGIQSPSKLTIEMGGHIAEGLAIGLENGAGRVAAAAAFLAEHGIKGIEVAAGELSVTVGNIQSELDQISFDRSIEKLDDLRWAVTEAAMAVNDAQQSTVIYDAALATAEKRYETAGQRVQDMAWALEDLAASGRSAADMTLESEMSVLRAEIAYDRAQERVETLTKRLGELDEGSAEYTRTSRELELAQLGVESAQLGVEDATRRANTVGEESDRIAREAAIAAGEEEEARRDVIDAANAQERDVRAAQDKLQESSRQLREHELKVAQDWMNAQQATADKAAESARSIGGSYGSIPARVETEVVLHTEGALQRLGLYVGAVNGATTAAAAAMDKAAESARLKAEQIARDAAGITNPTPVSTIKTGPQIVPAKTTMPAPVTGADIGFTASRASAAAFVGGSSNVRRMASGGLIPGPPGAPVPIVAHGGEALVPEHMVARAIRGGSASAGGSGEGTTIVVNVSGTASKRDAIEVVEALKEYQRRNGAIPIRTKG